MKFPEMTDAEIIRRIEILLGAAASDWVTTKTMAMMMFHGSPVLPGLLEVLKDDPQRVPKLKRVEGSLLRLYQAMPQFDLDVEKKRVRLVRFMPHA